MWANYFESLGISLAIYVVVRLLIVWQLRLPPGALETESKEPGTPIDASKISGRVKQLRQQPLDGMLQTTNTFKKPLQIEEKRRQLEKLAYFQKAPEPEPPEHDGGGSWSLLFV